MIKAIEKIIVGFIILFTLMNAGYVSCFGEQARPLGKQAEDSIVDDDEQAVGGDSDEDLKEPAEVEIMGSIGQVGADVVLGDSELGKMVRFGNKRSHFSGHIAPGSHIVKLESDNQVLWSNSFTAHAGREYFLDSSHGGTVPWDVIQEKRVSAEPAVQQSELNEINWIYDPEQGLELAAQQKKPIMMEFYADGSEQCNKLDKDVYSKSKIIDLSAGFISIKVNAEKYSDTASRFKAVSSPTIVFLNSDGGEHTRIVGYRDSAEFYSIMSRAAR